MTAPFLALITPVGGSPGYPDNSLPVPPGGVGIWPSPGVPTHPIAPGGPPPGIWPSPGHPAHPISPGGPPPGYWGGVAPPLPTPPIYFPPPGGQPPLGIWGGRPPNYVDIGGPGPQPRPEHPIVLPPNLPPETPEGGKIDWKTAWTPQTGWVVVGIPSEGTTVPTPSKK
jgi:hypothetical protein